jgi:hypothetical protein
MSELLLFELEAIKPHQSKLKPKDNKFHKGNGSDGKHYWLTPPELMAQLDAEFHFDFDPCPFPKPEDFDGLVDPWKGTSAYVNPPFGSIMHKGPNDKKLKKKGPTAWVRKALFESDNGYPTIVLVFPLSKWELMLMDGLKSDRVEVRNLGDKKWLATEDSSPGNGTGRHIACFILKPKIL